MDQRQEAERLLDQRQEAGRLRRRMHASVQHNDLHGLREAMHDLYLQENACVDPTPLSFAPIVEVAALSRALPASKELMEETLDNLVYTAERFQMDGHVTQIHKALMGIGMGENLRLADETMAQAVLNSPLEGRVRVSRHARR